MFGATIYRSVFEAEMVTLELTEREPLRHMMFSWLIIKWLKNEKKIVY